LKKDGFYYLFLAEGGTGKGHMITVLRSRNLRGPYENCPYNPIMTQKNPIAPIQCCGHGKPVDTPDGRWYMVYLCCRMIDGKWGMLGRETCLDEIIWTPDGWPVVGPGRGPSCIARMPFDVEEGQQESALPDPGIGLAGILSMAEVYSGGDDAGSVSSTGSSYGSYEKNSLWRFVRTMDKRFVRFLSEDKDELEITGDGHDLNDVECRSMALLHQTDFICQDAFSMECIHMPEGDEAGMVLYYDENSFIRFGIRNVTAADSSAGYEAYVCEYYDDSYVREEKMPVDFDGSAHLAVSSNRLVRSFYLEGKKIFEWKDVTGICSEGLSKGKRFTGTSIGVCVTGHGKYLFRRS
jgi:xylan 1,4-beta-xylosidase